MDLYLRRVKHHQAIDNYRVIADVDGAEIEVGSIGLTTFTSMDTTWTWGIDTVIPMREIESEGRGYSRKDCMARFRKAWDALATDHAWLDEFLNAKRRARR